MKKQEGITLIGLIITIIVLIILAVITIDVAIDGKLFDRAQNSVTETNNKTLQEQNEVNTIIELINNT